MNQSLLSKGSNRWFSFNAQAGGGALQGVKASRTLVVVVAGQILFWIKFSTVVSNSLLSTVHLSWKCGSFFFFDLSAAISLSFFS